MRLLLAVLLIPLAPAAEHPLDPLSREEITAAVRALKAAGKVDAASRFPIIVLREPPKQEVLGFSSGGAVRREAFLVVVAQPGSRVFEAVVDLNAGKPLSWNEVRGVRPPVPLDELAEIAAAVRADPRWREAMRKRGIEDFENVQVDPWPAGYYNQPDEDGVRFVHGVSYYRGVATNGYAQPIEGVVAYLDLETKKVFKLIDAGVSPLPAPAGLDPKSVGRQRRALKPLRITQPAGPAFTIQGQQVRWDNWQFRFSMHPREGLVLHLVSYQDQGRWRPVLYRASLSEMVVPYSDPGPAWFFHNVFDMGEYSLAGGTLEPGLDAPENAVFLDAVLADSKGAPVESPRVIALYERDGGLLWKHWDYVSNHNESRRARQLVISSVATAGNYEYGFNWVFHQDGTLEMEVLLTGIMSTKGVAQGHGHDAFGHLVAPNILAVHHQHFMNFRLDVDVDGPDGNRVLELNTESLPPGAGNPYSGAFTMKETPLRTELEARRRVDMAAGRRWKVINAAGRNSLGQPTGYLLVPGENALPYAAPGSWIRKRAGFLDAHLWVTPYEPTQTNAAGYYVTQSRGGDGLPKWTSANRSIDNSDVVLWYTLGVTHLPRPEEWPVMNVHRTGFRLAPAGFFSRNPALDVPR